MKDVDVRSALREAEALDDAAAWLRAAQHLLRTTPDEQAGLQAAASALDRAYGLAPDAEEVVAARQEVLDRLEVRANGFVFRHVPAGRVRIGSTSGDPDETPVHEVGLEGFWMADVPISWSAFNEVMGWPAPPDMPPRSPGLTFEFMHEGTRHVIPALDIAMASMLRGTYCRDTPWSNESFEDEPTTFAARPMIAASWVEALLLAARLDALHPGAKHRLPTEAEWEKAARGGLVGRRYAWGDEEPAGRCDFDRFKEAWGSGRPPILPSRCFPSNGYGLYSMCGGVWEWTSDDYDRDAYLPASERTLDQVPEARAKAARGGSWADCAEAVTVSFRMSAGRSSGPRTNDANIGIRLVRVAATPTRSGT